MVQKSTDSVIKVIFVCYGNACRSPMAEIICNSFGKKKIIAESAEVCPALPHIDVDKPTIAVMEEISLDISKHKPRHIHSVDLSPFDILINMSPVAAQDLFENYQPFSGKIIEWDVTDPRGRSPIIYRKVRDDLRGRVSALIKDLAGVGKNDN